MILLGIVLIWTVMLVLVVALAFAARIGDVQQIDRGSSIVGTREPTRVDGFPPAPIHWTLR